jgi:predicted phosphoribosyltransferase
MARINDLSQLRDRAPVFRDRVDAGQTLAEMLEADFRGSDAIVFAIPSGGVPVAAEIARRLALTLDVAVVSKILLPWTTESGFGAVAFDGTVWVNDSDARRHGLASEQVDRCTAAAREKVERRVKRLRGDRPLPDVARRAVILVDDGIAAGSTMRTAIAALRRLDAKRIVVAVPTGHDHSVREITGFADEFYCANVRAGVRYAVADAYEHWSDVTEDAAVALLTAATAWPAAQRAFTM